MRSRVLRRLSPHLKMTYLKISRQNGRPEVQTGRSTSSNRFSELLKAAIRVGQENAKNKANKVFRDLESDKVLSSPSEQIPEVDPEMEAKANQVFDQVFEHSGNWEKGHTNPPTYQ